MNLPLHRLVFSRHHGMLVAVAEHARSRGKAAGGERRGALAPLQLIAHAPHLRNAGAPLLLAAAVALALCLPDAMAQTRPPVAFASKLAAPPGNLPVPYGNLRLPGGGPVNATPRAFAYDPAKGSNSGDLAATGRVRWSVDGSSATFDQGSVERVVVNWDSFNIGPGYKLHFTQDKDPAKYVSALNRIWSADPSLIFGSLTADREVILLNANGVYFGRGARVDTGKFVATSLSIADRVFDKGLRNVTDGSSVFSAAGTDYLPTNLNGAVTVEAGAEIRSAAGGDVLLIAPRVVNQGRIETPGGQSVLAAGDKVYLMSSSDPKQRGLIVAVDPIKLAGTNTNDAELGIAENAASGSTKTVNGATVADNTPDGSSGLVNRLNEIRAESGTVNLVGLTVRQQGTINATTAVKGANGAIYLQAMASTVALPGGASTSAAGRRGLTIEAGSNVRVGADLGTVQIGAGSLTAIRADASGATQLDAESFNPSSIRVEGAAIAVAGGARIEAPAGKIELFAAQSSTPASAVFDRELGTLPVAGDASRIVIAPGAVLSVAGLRDIEIDGARNQGSQRLFRIELADSPLQRSGPLYRSQVYFDLRDAARGNIGAADVTGAAAAIARTARERSTVGGTLSIESEGSVVVGEGASLDVSGGSVHYAQTVLKNTLLERAGRVLLFKGAKAANNIDRVLAGTQSAVAPAYTEGKDGGTLTLSGRLAAVAGALRGQVVRGERQRDGSSPRAAPATLALGRQVGNDFFLDTIRLRPGTTAAIDPALFADPVVGSLASLPAGADLSLAAVQQAGFGALLLRATELTQTDFSALDLGVKGKLDLRADRVSLNGAYTAPGGSMTVATGRADASGLGDIRLSATTALDTAGRWTNDSALAAGSAGEIQPGGGKVSVAAAHSLLVEPGALIDVSAGARLSATGGLTKGTAGVIALTTGRSDFLGTRLQLDGATLKGFDFGSGGTLALGAPELTVTSASATGFALAPAFFSSGGFGSIAVDAFGDVVLPSGTQLSPQLRNWQLAAAYRAAPSGQMSARVASALPVDSRLADRSPVSLAFSASRTLNPSSNLPGGSVIVERGASIELEPGGKLSLSATRNLEVGARGPAGQASRLTAPGGRIDLLISGIRGVLPSAGSEGDPTGFLADQALWLGADAHLSVSGTAELRPDSGAPLYFFTLGGAAGASAPRDRVTGTVRGGGTIALDARRGYVVAAKGSSMALDGFAADVNLPGLGAPVKVAKAAGTLTVSTPEGYLLEGTISAQAPRGPLGALADGGRLDLSVGAGGVATATAGSPYPGTASDGSGALATGAAARPRQLLVGGGADGARLGGAVPGANLNLAIDNGSGYTAAALLQGAGFDSIRLAAGDQVRFDADLSLTKGLRIVLDAPALAVRAGAQVSLAAPYIAFGDNKLPASRPTLADTLAETDTSAARNTRLSLQAPLIEVLGNSALKGFSQVTLDAAAQGRGEIRLLGPSLGSTVFGSESTQGRLNFAGQLNLNASQVYATSGTEFTFSGLPAAGAGDPGSRFTVRAPAGAGIPATPLSAFGALSVSATEIDQGGVLRQPFGAIALSAERTLRLADGSLTSVSGAGAQPLYGETDNLSRWRLPTGEFATRLPRSKGVTLKAARIESAASATVDGSGGGDVKAWEFFPGVGGSSDYFAGSELYAVLPDYIDTRALAFGGLLDAAGQGRQIVITTAGSGLAPGRYNLLPARYALMGGSLPQGAYLVRRAADQGKAVLAASIRQDDGSVVVSGYFSEAGSTTTGVPGERFTIEPEATFRARSEIRTTSIGNLLAGQASASGSTPLPRDGAQVQLSATGSDSPAWRATLKLAADGGAAGLLDFSATRLALVDDLAKTPAGALGVSARNIADSGAGSVLLGGLRSAASTPPGSAPVWNIDQSLAKAVSVDIGQKPLEVEELVLTASGSIDLAPGTRIAATRSGTLGARTLAASGDGAVAVVSANRIDLRRTGFALAGGDLVLGAGTILSGPQLALDATGRLRVDRSASLLNDALSLGARRIVVGVGAAADPLATVLAGDLLSTVQLAPVLSLRSYSSIDFVGNQNWAGRPAVTSAEPHPAAALVRKSLLLDAPVVRGLDASGGPAALVDIAAESVLVRNTTGQIADPALTGQGSLVLQALPALRYGNTGGLTLGPGAVTLAFADASLRSSGDAVVQGIGSTRAQGDLTLSAARLTAGNAADQSVQANAGVLTIATEAGSRTLGERVGQGARVALAARSVQQLGTIDLAGGALSIAASGSGNQGAAVTFGAGSTTSVAGFALPGPDGFEAYGPAGTITASAAQGSIEILGTLDVGAARRAGGGAGSGDAGRIDLKATGSGGNLVLARGQASGKLLGQAGRGSTDLGGSLALDVSALGSVDALARAAAAGGLDAEFTLRVRSGDVALGTNLKARRIALSADSGNLGVGAVLLNAAAPSGGVVQLAAGNNLVLGSGARIDARAQRSGANGGDVLLASTSGRVTLAAGASIDTRGDDTQDGRIVLRAQRGANNTSVKIDALDTSRLLGGEVDIEAVRSYRGVKVGTLTRDIATIASGVNAIAGSGNGSTGTLGQASVASDNTAFMIAKPAVLGALGIGAAESGRVNLRAGVEVLASGNLTVNGNWALNEDRAGGDAGFLSLRAAGNLNLNGILTDGFGTRTNAKADTFSTSAALNANPHSWSYRLAAGADLTAANPLAVKDFSAATATTGNLAVAAGRMLRTGAGSIDLAAGRDIVFAPGSGNTAPGFTYVAGRRMAGEAALLASLFADQAAKPAFSEQGGRLSLQAGRDITSPEATQLINNWFWRSGLQSTRAGEEALYNPISQLAWWSEFGRFRQTLGSFGGGDLWLSAGHDIVNLQAMAPTAGWADSRVMAGAKLQLRNGGDVTVRAGHDLLGGQFFTGAGDGRIAAGGSVGAAPANVRIQQPVLALMDSAWRVTAGASLSIAGGFNPTAMSVPDSATAGRRQSASGFYYTWGERAGIDLLANSGNLSVTGLADSKIGGYGLVGDSADYARVFPASLTATAAGGNIDLFGQSSVASAVLFPSATGQLRLWADGDILLGGTLAQADSDIALWPGKNRPVSFRSSDVGALNGGNGLIASTLNDVLPRAALHAGDIEPVQVFAAGSIRAPNGALVLAKQARVTAGADVVDLQLAGQNLANGDITSVVAGRDIIQANPLAKIQIGGPGRLEVAAGRNLDLGASVGLSTIGNQRNASLPAVGASIKLTAAASGTLDLAAFEASYLDPAAQGVSARWQNYRDLLLASVRQALKQPVLTYEQAWAQFKSFPAQAQATFGGQVLAAEFGAVYLAGAAPTATQMTEALRAAFEIRKAQVLQTGEAARAAGQALTLPGREVLQAGALDVYLGELRVLQFSSLDLGSTVSARVANLAQIQKGWRDTVALSLGGTAADLDTLAARNAQDPAALAWHAALSDFSGRRFEAYRDQVLASETASAGAAASLFGRKSLPMRLALFDQGFQAAELAGAGSFVAQPVWPGATPVFGHTGAMEMTQSSVVTERGGAISLVNAGGAIDVGLKQNTNGLSSGKGVIALGGGNVFGYARTDFQVNNQRVFIVGQGDMNLWSSSGDIDSGRGANTAVAAPPLSARRSVDGVVFEVPATTTGSGLGILEDASGIRSGTIGLYPAFGEILALDAFIRAPSVVLGSTIRGADNLQAASVGGAAAPVSAPVLAVAAPSSTTNRTAQAQAGTQSQQEQRPRNSLLTVDLLGLGPAPAEEECKKGDGSDAEKAGVRCN